MKFLIKEQDIFADGDDEIIGIITDGDLRRMLEKIKRLIL